jgi:hypothetical protein
MPARLANLLLLLVVTLLTLAAAEVGLRLAGFDPTPLGGNENYRVHSEFGFATFDPTLGWQNREGTSLSVEPGHAPMTFWAEGRRAARPDPAPTARRKLAIVGDSFSQGYGIRDEETYAWRLAELAPGWDVENYGTGGYGAYQSLLRMRRFFASNDPRSEPKLVVYGYTYFHAYRDVAGEAWVKTMLNEQGEYFAPPSVTTAAGDLVEHPFETIPQWPLETRSALIARAKRAYLRRLFGDRERYAEEATKLLIGRMRNLATENQARFVLMALTPIPTSVEESMRSRAIDFVPCFAFDPHVVLQEPEYKVGGVGHPNGKVHDAWSRCLAEWMRAKQLL